MIFAAATGLRPGEWLALERRDIDCDEQVVYVRRTLRNGRLKTPKTKVSVRAVPLQATALAALEELRQPQCRNFCEALWRIRTADPLLTSACRL